MLEAACARGVYASLHEAEAGETGLKPEAYDLVVSCLVDEHLADLRPLYAEAARLARPGGRCVLVGFHPHFIIASGMPTHFDDANRASRRRSRRTSEVGAFPPPPDLLRLRLVALADAAADPL